MVLRKAKTGLSAGKKFWGCSGYTACKAILEVGEGGDAQHATLDARDQFAGSMSGPGKCAIWVRICFS